MLLRINKKKWNYYTYLDLKYPLGAYFHHYSIFQEFSKKVIFCDFLKHREGHFIKKCLPEVDVGHQSYMIKRNIPFLPPPPVNFLKTFSVTIETKILKNNYQVYYVDHKPIFNQLQTFQSFQQIFEFFPECLNRSQNCSN